jgi:hypothetical protein
MIVSKWARRTDVDWGKEEIGGMWAAWTTMDKQGRTVGRELLGLCVNWLKHDLCVRRMSDESKASVKTKKSV